MCVRACVRVCVCVYMIVFVIIISLRVRVCTITEQFPERQMTIMVNKQAKESYGTRSLRSDELSVFPEANCFLRRD